MSDKYVCIINSVPRRGCGNGGTLGRRQTFIRALLYLIMVSCYFLCLLRYYNVILSTEMNQSAMLLSPPQGEIDS